MARLSSAVSFFKKTKPSPRCNYHIFRLFVSPFQLKLILIRKSAVQVPSYGTLITLISKNIAGTGSWQRRIRSQISARFFFFLLLWTADRGTIGYPEQTRCLLCSPPLIGCKAGEFCDGKLCPLCRFWGKLPVTCPTEWRIYPTANLMKQFVNCEISFFFNHPKLQCLCWMQ